jgi:hypothetical protein
MKILKNLVIAVIALVAVLAVIGLLLPRTYKMERSVVIHAPAEIAFDQVNDLKKNENWSPWKAADPTVQINYGSTTVGKGAMSSWTSQKSGEGTMTIVESNPNQDIQTELDFKGMGKSTGYFTFTPEVTSDGQAIRVLQGMRGDLGYNLPARYMNLMMEKMVGPMFEKGLAKLKEVSESEAARMKTEQEATRQALSTPPDEAPAKSAK